LVPRILNPSQALKHPASQGALGFSPELPALTSSISGCPFKVGPVGLAPTKPTWSWVLPGCISLRELRPWHLPRPRRPVASGCIPIKAICCHPKCSAQCSAAFLARCLDNGAAPHLQNIFECRSLQGSGKEGLQLWHPKTLAPRALSVRECSVWRGS
jgi:hypothetical protein